ncbi:MAG: hypothetical protein FWD38_07210 [Oscillospiraceae bacterium]|nr:hypothetical protein [Oscillospiraceae bacterium]
MKKVKLSLIIFFVLCSFFILSACKSSDNSSGSADIIIKYESNTLLNKYDIEIYLNGRNLGSIRQGESKTFPATLISGTNRLRTSRVDNVNNSFEIEFDNVGDGKYSFTSNARMGGLEIKFNSGPREGLYTVLFVIGGLGFTFVIVYFSIKLGKKTDVRIKREEKVTSLISASKIYSITEIAFHSHLSNDEVVDIINDRIQIANQLPNDKKCEEYEKYRFLRNAQIDKINNKIILDEGAMKITSKLDNVTNAINKIFRGTDPEVPKEKVVTCDYCGGKNTSTSESINKCNQCGAPL